MARRGRPSWSQESPLPNWDVSGRGALARTAGARALTSFVMASGHSPTPWEGVADVGDDGRAVMGAPPVIRYSTPARDI